MSNTTPKNQDIYIVAPTKAAMKDMHAQDIIIGALDEKGHGHGILYHVHVNAWYNDAHKIKDYNKLPTALKEGVKNDAVLAYLRLEGQPSSKQNSLDTSPEAPGGVQDPEPRTGYYLANFSMVNNDDLPIGSPPDEYPEPPGGMYRLSQEDWRKNRLRAGDSTFVLQMLQRGTTFAYIPPASRTTDCVCYVLNLASINRSRIFEPTPEGQSCEIPSYPKPK
ncbi:hypothetical protein [Archangium violaceum]|uniref:Uncharacterized protein n=1 Tax=Archangium violaceum Cb vi76 TaxID=1406225 RepID=A0A084T051_9BACT|nr:hypothetical protein [Archangium violaceum]KFA94086.1 hypothetical protein Q664_04750 [Archangium violaceum Cb vi76]